MLLPFRLTTWKSLVWMWKVCHSSFSLTSDHCSTDPSFIVTSVRLGSNVIPLRRYFVLPEDSVISLKTIVRLRSTCLRRRSTGWLSTVFPEKLAWLAVPPERRVSTVSLGTGPPLDSLSPPGNWENGIALTG